MTSKVSPLGTSGLSMQSSLMLIADGRSLSKFSWVIGGGGSSNEASRNTSSFGVCHNVEVFPGGVSWAPWISNPLMPFSKDILMEDSAFFWNSFFKKVREFPWLFMGMSGEPVQITKSGDVRENPKIDRPVIKEHWSTQILLQESVIPGLLSC